MNTRFLSLKEKCNETKDIFKPEFFRLTNENQRQSFYSLIESSGIFLFDELYDQLKELIKSRNPTLKLSAEDYKMLIDKHLNGCPLIDYGVWVYYPWSLRLAHILDKKEFIEIRTNRNKYKITDAEQSLLAGKKIGVIGLSVGQAIEKIKVLYIDDEQNNLNGFKATFRFDYSILIAIDVKHAYEHLNNHPDISVILCDQRMPDVTGSKFFEEMRELFPDPVRMLITGYSDIDSVIEAVNKGHIFRYIKKPWTDADIRTAIEEGNKFYITNSLLASKNKELELAYDELGKFAYSVTHDLRGPLLSVIGALDMAKSIDNISELRELLGMMDDAVKKLDEFIKSTHEYYNLKRGELIFEQIDFNNILSDTAAMFRIAGRMENIRFTDKVIQNATFVSDTISIKIILNNLFSNAFKFQRKKAADKFVDVSIEVINNKAIIIVKDNGIGIHDSHINNIFTMFYRATSEEPGSGFGLYNVKDALNKLKGSIEVSSVVNEGTTFKVTIPGKANVAI